MYCRSRKRFVGPSGKSVDLQQIAQASRVGPKIIGMLYCDPHGHGIIPELPRGLWILGRDANALGITPQTHHGLAALICISDNGASYLSRKPCIYRDMSIAAVRCHAVVERLHGSMVCTA